MITNFQVRLLRTVPYRKSQVASIMERKGQSRQLAAIMFTDIAGYTALMQQDEEKAVKVRKRHRKVFEATTAKFNGKILQYYGDGTLSIFNSAIDSVMCGIEMQEEFQQWPQIPVRIGIHLGDIIYDQDINQLVMEMDYVHQLQNLWFVLKEGDELIIQS